LKLISIFAPLFKYNVQLFNNFPNSRFYHSVDDFKKNTDLFKIAVIPQNTSDGDYSQVMQFKDFSDVVIVGDGEFHEWHPLNDDEYSWKNIYWYGPGYTKKNNEYIIPFQQHLNKMQKLYQTPRVRDQLSRLNPYQSKSISFDALLGRPRPSRVFIMEQIQAHGLESKIINSMFPSNDYSHWYQSMEQLPGFVWEDDYVYADSQDVNRINSNINYYGTVASLGNIIPISTYNQAAFSILSETEHNNSVYMLTEKTAKVTIGRRVFVAFAGQGFLQLVHDLGFQTFDGIIDESYDLIENDQDRWQAAFDQVIKLCNSDQMDILSQARPTLEHNYNIIMNYPWQEVGEQMLINKLKDLIKHV
jgi:hypothetical protein